MSIPSLRAPAAVALALCLGVAAPAAASRGPAVAITVHPAHFASSGAAVLSWRHSAAQRTECTLGPRVIRRCAPPFRARGLADGWHVFSVRVFAGRRSAADSFRWLVDTRPPSAPDVRGASNRWARERAVSARGARDTGSGIGRYQHRVRRSVHGPWASPGPGARVVVHAQGASWIEFRAIDRAGNASAWTPGGGAEVRVDTLAPSVPVVSGYDPESEWATGPVHLVARSHDATSGVGHYQYQAYDPEWEMWLPAVPCDGHWRLAGHGWREFRFRAVDRAGNWSRWTRPALIDLE